MKLKKCVAPLGLTYKTRTLTNLSLYFSSLQEISISNFARHYAHFFPWLWVAVTLIFGNWLLQKQTITVRRIPCSSKNSYIIIKHMTLPLKVRPWFFLNRIWTDCHRFENGCKRYVRELDSCFPRLVVITVDSCLVKGEETRFCLLMAKFLSLLNLSV